MLRASWFPGADPAARTQLLDDGALGSFLSALMWVIIGNLAGMAFDRICRPNDFQFLKKRPCGPGSLPSCEACEQRVKRPIPRPLKP
jgi:hypothetical protein